MVTETRFEEDECALIRSWLPTWVQMLGAPVWITSPTFKIAYVNERAERLLRVRAPEILGRDCYRVMQGLDNTGQPFCVKCCPAMRTACAERELEPLELGIRTAGAGRSRVRLLWIPLQSPHQDGTWLVHCALAAGGTTDELEHYLNRVASRSRQDHPTDWNKLTPREHEIMQCLAQDLDLPAIAKQLHVSLVTVRNHVQHILVKMDCHSVQEVVARYLLEGATARHRSAIPRPPS